ncbi:Thiosulfate sulfurtransferase TUM1 [Nakaseomyces bracarensis]|uniref:Sulfurtransferase n=1 Tax=Nakaseomyces bracarensis TaxID=273131 RepID=A0ABR4NVD6_9SACH
MLYKLVTPKAFVETFPKLGKRVIPVDSTWYLPNLKRDGKQEFLDVERIPGAVYFDIDEVREKSTEFPHMAPDLSTFNAGMSQLGLKRDDVLVVYDRIGNFSGPRCAWTLVTLGHPEVYLLNNFNVYKELGYPLDTAKRNTLSGYPPTEYCSETDLRGQSVVSYEQMMELVNSGELKQKYNVYDARALDRFEGKAPEPRPDISSGHIPGVQPLPFTEVLEDGNKTFPQDPAAMQARIQDAFKALGDNYDPNKQTIVMCGTGVTGCIIKTALEHSGIPDVKLYDGSWVEWVLRSDPKYIAKNRD